MTITETEIVSTEALQESLVTLLGQWAVACKNASIPSMESPVFSRLPNEYYVDVPKAKMTALETARIFAEVSAQLVEQGAPIDKPAIYKTLSEMSEFCSQQFKNAGEYADLKWPLSLRAPKGEDVNYQKLRRDRAQEAVLCISDALSALNNG